MKPEVDTLTIVLDGKDSHEVTLESFVRVISATRGMLSDLDKDKSLVWRVKDASLNSPFTLTIAAESAIGPVPGVVDDFMTVFRALDGDEKLPHWIPQRAVSRARTIGKTLDNGVGKISFSSPGRNPVSPRVMPAEKKLAAQKQVGPAEYYDRVELEGILRSATTREGDTTFMIVDRITKNETRCEVDRNLFIQALEAMKSEKPPRVAVYGRTLYRNNRPSVMFAERLKVLPATLSALWGEASIDITSGMDSVDYVRSLRND